MAKFTNTSGGDLDLPSLGLHVAAGESFEVPDEDAAGLAFQPAFGADTTTDPAPVVPEIVQTVVAPAVDATQGE
jgi:hypothetical protein